MEKIIFHIDVNSAYLSWSAADKLKNGEKLDIRLVPSVIGGDENSRRGGVLAKSDKAKYYGIITGESLYSARKKCNDLIVIPPEIIRKEIKEKFNFTVSIGVATNKLLAKMASELKKPDKVNTIFKEEIEMKLWHLPVEELFMVGKSAKKTLNLMYIYTIGELATSDKALIKDKLKSMGELIWNYANGIDFSKVEYDEEDIKNISNETTLATDLLHREKAHRVILELSDKVSYRLRKNNKYCYSIGINIKTNEFKSYSHQKKILNPTNSTKIIYKIATELFDKCWKGEPIRLLGINLSNLTDTYIEQLSLLSLKDDKKMMDKESIDKVLDNIREKYGKV